MANLLLLQLPDFYGEEGVEVSADSRIVINQDHQIDGDQINSLFRKELIAIGGGEADVSACVQCGTCTASCELIDHMDMGPRKLIRLIKLGFTDQALKAQTHWICMGCNVCTSLCPYGVRVSDVMATLRHYSITYYAVPKFMGRALSDARYLPLLFAFPAIIFLAVLALTGNLTSLPTGQIVFSKFMPIIYIEAIFILAVSAAVVAVIAGGLRYWKGMSDFLPESRNGSLPRGMISTLIDILKHGKFQRCEGDRVGTRNSYESHLHKSHFTLFYSHLVVFYGFLGLAITTASVGVGIYAFGYLTPWPLWHPVKILGNVSGATVLIACGVFLYRRLKDKEKAGKSTYSDWLFLWVLALTTLTGFLSEILRLAGIPPLAYWVYLIHLVFIFSLLVYIPYSKFAHLAYRFVAMLSEIAGHGLVGSQRREERS